MLRNHSGRIGSDVRRIQYNVLWPWPDLHVWTSFALQQASPKCFGFVSIRIFFHRQA